MVEVVLDDARSQTQCIGNGLVAATLTDSAYDLLLPVALPLASSNYIELIVY